jgi:hypothetical protein
MFRAIRTQLGGALHSASADLSDVGADRPFAGMAFDEMRRPGTERTRSGSRSSPGVSAHLAIIPVLGPRTKPSNAAPLRRGRCVRAACGYAFLG